MQYENQLRKMWTITFNSETVAVYSSKPSIDTILDAINVSIEKAKLLFSNRKIKIAEDKYEIKFEN